MLDACAIAANASLTAAIEAARAASRHEAAAGYEVALAAAKAAAEQAWWCSAPRRRAPRRRGQRAKASVLPGLAKEHPLEDRQETVVAASPAQEDGPLQCGKPAAAGMATNPDATLYRFEDEDAPTELACHDASSTKTTKTGKGRAERALEPERRGGHSSLKEARAKRLRDLAHELDDASVG